MIDKTVSVSLCDNKDALDDMNVILHVMELEMKRLYRLPPVFKKTKNVFPS